MDIVLAETAAKLYWPPILAMALLPFLIALGILATRMVDLFSGRGAKFYEEYAGIGGPPSVQRTTNQLKNLFEFPMLFYATLGIAVACGLADELLSELAVAFAATRWLHAAVHLFANRLWIRTPIFMLSNMVLLGILTRMTLLLFR